MTKATSLYKARIYVSTNSGKTYLYPNGTNWKDNPIDNTLTSKLSTYGIGFNYNSINFEKSYYFIGLNSTAAISSSSISLPSVISGNSFSITPVGGGTAGYWATLIASGVFSVTITDIVAASKTIDELVDNLNSLLTYTQACLVSGSPVMASHFFEFFKFDDTKIGLKTKELYSSSTTTEYNFTLANVNGTFVTTAIKLPIVLISGSVSKCQTDFLTLESAISGGTDIIIKQYNSMTTVSNLPSYSIVHINGDNIAEAFIDVHRIPEDFRLS